VAPQSLLAIIDTAQVSGPGRQLTALLQRLQQAGTETRVLTFHRDGRPPAPFVAFLESAGIPCVVVRERGRFDLSLIGRVRTAVRAIRPQVVQTHSYKATVLAWLLRRMGEPFRWVGCFHGATSENAAVRAYHRLDLRLLRAADRVVIMAEAQRAALGPASAGAVVINNAVLPPPTAGLPPGLPPATFAYIGRLSPEKGCDILIEAVADLERSGLEEPWSVVVAGDGPEREALTARVATLGLGHRVDFLGQVADPWTVYRRVECVVLPSRSEGLPNVLLEAIAADRAVVATTVGAVPSVIGSSAAAILVPPDDAGALAVAMRQARERGGSAEASRARSAIASEYSLERRVAAHLAIYESLR